MCASHSVRLFLLVLAVITVASAALGEEELDGILVPRITEVTVTLEKSDPPNLIVEAKGQTPTPGYGFPRLMPVGNGGGLYHFHFVVIPPDPPPLVTATGEVTATTKLTPKPPDLRAVRIHGSGNCETKNVE